MNQLPFKEFTKADFGTRETIRDNTKRGDEIYQIPLDKVIVRDNFNVRHDFGDIEGLANSILQNGQTQAGIVDTLANGTFVLVDGHRRTLALKLIWERTGILPMFEARVNKKGTTEEQRILQMFTSQDNKQLTPHECATQLKRLMNLGYSNQSDIARKIGKTPAYVSQMLSYANESDLIKDEVVNGNISVATVIQLQKDIPSQPERIAKVKDAVKKAAEKKDQEPASKSKLPGKAAKVTLQDVTGLSKHEQLAKEFHGMLDDAIFRSTMFTIKDIEAVIRKHF